MHKSLWLALAISVLGFALSAAPWEPSRTATSAVDMLAELQKVYPEVAPADPTNMVTHQIGYHFSAGGGLSGEDLYLFSDATYIYTEWSDTLRQTIFDKGSWDMTNGFVGLTSDKSLPARFGPRDHTYLPARLIGRDGLFLMGHRRGFSYFLENAGDNPALMFKIVAMRCSETLSVKNGKQTKARLLKKALRQPGFYQ